MVTKSWRIDRNGDSYLAQRMTNGKLRIESLKLRCSSLYDAETGKCEFASVPDRDADRIAQEIVLGMH